jgi:DNA-binding GntR family transcriptional regulator
VLARSIAAISARSSAHRLRLVERAEARRRLREGHMAVLHAVRAGNPEAAERAMRAHLGVAQQLTVAAVKRAGPEPAP